MSGGRRRPRAPRLKWWREVLYILAFYSVYSFIRNEGVATDSSVEAFRNARQVIRVERAFGSFHEEAIQDAFLGADWFIRFWNIFYGTAHFIVTVVALVYLFRRMSHRYPLWRNTLACTTGLALVGFAFYPLMPPRLLPASYGFVDTLKDVGGLWSFESGAVAKISNQYAAMPSLHFAWSAWCAFVLCPALRKPWQRALMVSYPFLTLFAIVVTANHYWLDAAGGAVILAVGFVLGRTLTKVLADRGRQPVPESAPLDADADLIEPAVVEDDASGTPPGETEPEPAEPAEAQPVTDPVVAEPAMAEPVPAEPLEADAAEPEPEAVEPEAVEPVRPEAAAAAEPLPPEPLPPEPMAVLEPVTPEAPAGPEPEAVEALPPVPLPPEPVAAVEPVAIQVPGDSETEADAETDAEDEDQTAAEAAGG